MLGEERRRAVSFFAMLGVTAALWWTVSRCEAFHDPLQSLPIYIISLKRRPERLRACLAHLRRAGRAPGVHVIDAVDGLDLRDVGKTKLTRGEIGCFLSHLKTLDVIARSDAPYGVVLEDDARLGVSRRDLGMLIREAPRDVDVISLGCNAFPGPPHTRQVSERLHEFVDYDLYGAHAMIYSRRGAQALLREATTKGFDVPYDYWLTQHGPARLAVAHPPLARPADVKDSETQKTR